MTPERIAPEEARVTEALDLIRTAFAGMEGRVDPPSSMHRMTLASLTDDARTKELWGIGAPLIACVILTEKPGRLYIGKLAVAEAMQGKGLARALIGVAEERARELGLDRLELETRVELTENHAVFTRLGFVETGRNAHAGYDRPTSITFQKPV
ncbi:GNAT family N-acetyltransferase [Celeribacter ethanolicus]|uniref:GNAT family N-acetyltransferase n=1 Tax=Celeribacter ethanolicus TaxID=1758178 RepID=A0A291GF98_9RHOB|nr:GNAT family N-acetyltransferase [Celeribacter ethanolicus]ATG48686.1 GNAT family N-acetyltransferase [Celeribacter ethanolicus]